MSGLKYSSYAIEAQRQQRLDLQNQLQRAVKQRQNIQQKLQEVLSSASRELQSSFPEEFRNASFSLQSFNNRHSDVNQIRDINLLREELIKRQRELASGVNSLQALESALNVKASAIAKQSLQSLAEINAEYYQQKDLLEVWDENPTPANWEARLSAIKRRIERQDFRNLEKELKENKSLLTKQVEIARQLEDQHQKRLYLLKALRQVCQDLGFQEVQEPSYEQPEKKTSRIHFVVDTLDRGKIDFQLGLDGIHTNSQLSSQNCFEEFDQLSDKLKETFGVVTHFDPPEGERPPVLIRRGEKDNPHGRQMERKA